MKPPEKNPAFHDHVTDEGTMQGGPEDIVKKLYAMSRKTDNELRALAFGIALQSAETGKPAPHMAVVSVVLVIPGDEYDTQRITDGLHATGAIMARAQHLVIQPKPETAADDLAPKPETTLTDTSEPQSFPKPLAFVIPKRDIPN